MNNTGELEYYLNRIVLLTKKMESIKHKEDFETPYNQQEYKKLYAKLNQAKYHIIKMFNIKMTNQIEYR